MKKADTGAAQCPVQHDVNPLNQMPELQQHSISSNQSTSLPTERVVSTIPRDERAKWEYPSPQQFYNALVRKGWETPEQHVETMVEIHNFLNEQAWNEVVRWEERVNGLDILSPDQKYEVDDLSQCQGFAARSLSRKTRSVLPESALLHVRRSCIPFTVQVRMLII
jgi:hypothetical protein